MKQNEEKVKKEIIKVFKDLELHCDERYPTKCSFVCCSPKSVQQLIGL